MLVQAREIKLQVICHLAQSQAQLIFQLKLRISMRFNLNEADHMVSGYQKLV